MRSNLLASILVSSILFHHLSFIIGYCRGGSDFGELNILRDLHINNGSVLVNGYISESWVNVLYWRTFLGITAHYLSIYIILSICLKKGFIIETFVDQKFEEVLHRPPEDTTTMFSFVRQMFYHKTLAYTIHEKNSKVKLQRKCC